MVYYFHYLVSWRPYGVRNYVIAHYGLDQPIADTGAIQFKIP